MMRHFCAIAAPIVFFIGILQAEDLEVAVENYGNKTLYKRATGISLAKTETDQIIFNNEDIENPLVLIKSTSERNVIRVTSGESHKVWLTDLDLNSTIDEISITDSDGLILEIYKLSKDYILTPVTSDQLREIRDLQKKIIESSEAFD